MRQHHYIFFANHQVMMTCFWVLFSMAIILTISGIKYTIDASNIRVTEPYIPQQPNTSTTTTTTSTDDDKGEPASVFQQHQPESEMTHPVSSTTELLPTSAERVDDPEFSNMTSWDLWKYATHDAENVYPDRRWVWCKEISCYHPPPNDLGCTVKHRAYPGGACCTDFVFTLMSELERWLDDHFPDMPHFVHYGTLLGAMRNEDVIQGTADADFAVKLVEVLSSDQARYDLWQNRGIFLFKDPHSPRTGRACFHNERPARNRTTRESYMDRFPYADLYSIYEVDPVENKYKTLDGPCIFPYGEILPPAKKAVKIRGVRFDAPLRYRTVLSRIYGNHWEEAPETPTKWHGSYTDSYNVKCDIARG